MSLMSVVNINVKFTVIIFSFIQCRDFDAKTLASTMTTVKMLNVILLTVKINSDFYYVNFQNYTSEILEYLLSIILYSIYYLYNLYYLLPIVSIILYNTYKIIVIVKFCVSGKTGNGCMMCVKFREQTQCTETPIYNCLSNANISNQECFVNNPLLFPFHKVIQIFTNIPQFYCVI